MNINLEIQLIDMQERQADFAHTCKSADHKEVKLTGYIVWRIANVEAFWIACESQKIC